MATGILKKKIVTQSGTQYKI